MEQSIIHRLSCIAMLLLAHAARAGPIEQNFEAGVLGIKWGTPLAEVQGAIPNGFTWKAANVFATAFVHEARVNTGLFGLDSRDVPVHFRFDGAERFIGIAMYFPYSRKDDVLYQIAQTLGHNYQVSSTRLESHSTWPSQSKLRVTLSIGNREPHHWVVLHVYSEDSEM